MQDDKQKGMVTALLRLVPALDELNADTNKKIQDIIELFDPNNKEFRIRGHLLENLIQLFEKKMSNDSAGYLGRLFIEILRKPEIFLYDNEIFTTVLDIVIKYKRTTIIEEVKKICISKNKSGFYYSIFSYIEKKTHKK